MVHNRYNRRKEQWMRRTFFVLQALLLCVGTDGIFLMLHYVPSITFRLPIVLFTGISVCVLLYISKLWKGKWSAKVTAGIIGSYCCAGIILRNTLTLQAEEFFRSLADSATKQETDVTLFMVFLSVAAAIVLFMLEIIFRQHWFPYLAVTAVMAGGPLFGIRTGVFPMLWGLVFQVLFWAIQTGTHRRKEKPVISLRSAVFVSGVLAVSVCVSVLITAVWGDILPRGAYVSEGFASRSLREISGSAKDPAASGHISSGNNYRTGELQMNVTLTKKPGEPLYLKGFTGGNYTGGDWEEADDTALFHEMAQILDWEEWESWIAGLYFPLYFSMNAAGMDIPEDEQRTVFINYAENSYSDVFFAPYYSMWMDFQENDGAGYGYRYFESEEMDIDWDDVPEDFTTLRDWYRQVQQAYLQVIPDAYTEVPETLLPRLTDLCRNRSFHSVDEVTAFILSILRSHASYTLTPGRAPLNVDIVESFLFDSHEGYCVHFASAAALMYRLCGVPARYASGYLLQPSDFTRQEDGTWMAQVTDKSAHAWTEIFLEDYGWVPVDMTPSSDGEDLVDYPGLDHAVLEEMSAFISGNMDPGENGSTDPSETDAGSREEDTGRNGNRGNFFEQYPQIRSILFAVLCESLILAPAFIDGYRLRKRKKEEAMNCRQIFSILLHILQRNGYMTGYTGNEKDFAGKLTGQIPCVGKKEAEKLAEIVSRAAYGPEDVKEEENKFVHDIYFKICRWIKGVKRQRRRGVFGRDYFKIKQ